MIYGQALLLNSCMNYTLGCILSRKPQNITVRILRGILTILNFCSLKRHNRLSQNIENEYKLGYYDFTRAILYALAVYVSYNLPNYQIELRVYLESFPSKTLRFNRIISNKYCNLR